MKRLSLVAMLGILGSGGVDADSGPKETVVFEEPFAARLREGWSWVREDPKAWRIENGALVLRTLPGYLHARYNDTRNVLLRTLPKSNHPLAIEVEVEGGPKVTYEHAGLVWYVDDDNYVALVQEVLGGKVELQMVAEKAAKPSFRVKPDSAKTVWLRLVISAENIDGQCRLSQNEPWRDVGRFPVPVHAAARVGVMAGGAPKDAERHVRFRAFRIVESIGG